MKLITREPEPLIDYDACRKRLETITTDAAALDSFERVAQSGEMESESRAPSEPELRPNVP